MVLLTGVALAVIGAVGLTIRTLAIRVGTRNGRVLDALAVVFLLGTAVIVPVALVVSYPIYRLTPVSVIAFAIAGLANTMIGMAFHYTAIKRVGGSRAESIKASQALIATFIAIVFLGETLSLAHLGAIILITIGVVLLATDTADDPITGEKISTQEYVFPLGAALFFGIAPVFVKIGLAAGTHIFVGLAISWIVGGLGLFFYLFVRNELPTSVRLRPDLKSFVAAGVGTTVFMMAYYSGLAIAPVNVIVPIIQTSPLLVVVVSALFLRSHERITLQVIVGTIVLVSGAIGVTILG